MDKTFPKRKHPRLKEYDYSTPGAYFITICTQNKRCILSKIVGQGSRCSALPVADTAEHKRVLWSTIEEGACTDERVGRRKWEAPAEVQLTVWGNAAREQLLLLENRYPNLKIDQFVIMPNHIHAILFLEAAAGASPRPTITDIVCAYKSLTTKQCRTLGYQDKLFQTSFYEHVIRGQADYDEIAQYILNNPKKWELDQLYSAE